MNKKIKRKCKLLVDLSMTVLLMLLMSYMIAGAKIHEWFGCAMFLLFVGHHLLNLQWHKNLFRGRYSGTRILYLLIDLFILIGMMTSMITGIMMSRYVFSWLDIRTGISYARRIHMLAAYWNFVLMSIHLGLHWGVMVGAVANVQNHRLLNNPMARRVVIWVARLAACLVACYGFIQFRNMNLMTYLLGRVTFAYYNFKIPLWSYVARYASIMAAIVFLTYYFMKLLRILTAKKYRNHSLNESHVI